jgi:hypothetical protein
MIQAETTEDLYEWKTALENVLAHAPSATNVMGQSGIFRSYQADSLDIYLDQCMFLLLLGFIHIDLFCNILADLFCNFSVTDQHDVF